MTNEPISDADWMAYVDGDLDAPARQRVEAALALDPALAARVHAQQQLRDRLQRGLAAELEEPLPDRFAALLAPAAQPAAQPLLAGAGQLAGGGGSQRWLLLLGAGLLAGLLLPRPWLDGGGDELRLQGPLAQALEQGLGSEPASQGYRLALSFRNHAGEFCRAFSGADQAGLACKQGEAWRLRVLVPAPAQSGELRQAGGALPAAVLEAVDAQLQGQTLDAAAEREARARGWR